MEILQYFGCLALQIGFMVKSTLRENEGRGRKTQREGGEGKREGEKEGRKGKEEALFCSPTFSTCWFQRTYPNPFQVNAHLLNSAYIMIRKKIITFMVQRKWCNVLCPAVIGRPSFHCVGCQCSLDSIIIAELGPQMYLCKLSVDFLKQTCMMYFFSCSCWLR